MSAFVDMAQWNAITTLVYTELLKNSKTLDAAIDAACAKRSNGRRQSLWLSARAVKSKVESSLVDTTTPVLTRRLVSQALKDVNWNSLTRRLIRQGKLDRHFYQTLTTMLRSANESQV